MIDSHAHMAFKDYRGDRKEVFERCRQAKIRWIEVGTSMIQSRKAIQLAKDNQELILGSAVGVHPTDITSMTENDWGQLESWLEEAVVVAIGEVGFDFYHGGTREKQEPALRRFVALAKKYDLPLIFHLRSSEQEDAYCCLLNFLQAENEDTIKGVVHSFGGNLKQAKNLIELGLHVGFNGIVTFKNAMSVQEVAAELPLASILLETDSPYLSPHPYRGRRNDPEQVKLVASKIAELKGVLVSAVTEVCDRNATSLFLR